MELCYLELTLLRTPRQLEQNSVFFHPSILVSYYQLTWTPSRSNRYWSPSGVRVSLGSVVLSFSIHSIHQIWHTLLPYFWPLITKTRIRAPPLGLVKALLRMIKSPPRSQSRLEKNISKWRQRWRTLWHIEVSETLSLSYILRLVCVRGLESLGKNM